MEELNDLNRLAYWPVAIRLLGQQTIPLAHSIVRSRFTKSLRSCDLHSHDWTLAGLEADRLHAINAIGLALKDRRKTRDDKKALVRVLSDAGSSQTRFQDDIIRVFADILDREPELTLQLLLQPEIGAKLRYTKSLNPWLCRKKRTPQPSFS